LTISEEALPCGHADASYAEEEDRKSRTGYAFYAYGCLVSWASRKQNTVSLSSTIAEYLALSSATEEAIWIKQFFDELEMSIQKPLIIYQDNKSTIAIANNPVKQKHTKYMDVKAKFIEEHIQKGDIKLVYCSTENMIADIFTKPLNSKLFKKFRGMLGLRSFEELQKHH